MASRWIFLMSPPGPGWALRGRANFRSAAAGDVDPRAALREWLGLADAIEARGGRVVCLVPDDDRLTGLPYAAEAGHAITLPDGGRSLLLPTMAKPHRTGERELWARVAGGLGMTTTNVTGLWEAQGDVADFRGRTLLFFGGRTTREGAESAARWFDQPILLEIREPAFHGNMALLPLAHVDRILVCRDVLAETSWRALVDAFGESSLVLVSEDEIRSYATNGLPLDGDLLAPSLLPTRVRELVRALGMRVVDLPMDELCGKAGGASRCLVSRALVEEAMTIPPSLDYRVRRAELVARSR